MSRAELPRMRRGRPAALVAAGVLLVALGIALLAGGLDSPWMLAVHAHAPLPTAVVLWSSLTILGLGWSALILVLAADRGDGRVAALLLPTFVLGSVLTHLPKWLWAVTRPAGSPIADQLHVIGEAFRGAVSMPSGHALTAAAAVVLLWLALPRIRAVATVLLAALAALVGASRIVVGAHWPSDVAVGAGLGLLAAALPWWVTGWPPAGRVLQRFAARIRSPVGQGWVALVETAAAAGLLAERNAYPAGRPMVLLLAGAATASAVWRCVAARQHARASRALNAVESP